MMTCQCGHRKRSHRYALRTPAGTRYIYRSCRKQDCDCRGYAP